MKTIKINYLIIILAFLGFNTAIAQVGIGTDAPTNKLDVDGDVRIRTIEDLPNNATFKNIVADDNGVVKSIETSRVLAGGDGVDAIPTGTTISTFSIETAQLTSRTFTLTQRSIVSFSSSVSVVGILQPNGSPLTDKIGKFFRLELEFDETGGDPVSGDKIIVRGSFPFTSAYGNSYMSGFYYINVSASRILEPGTYKIDFIGRAGTPAIESYDQGVKATFGGATQDRIDIIAQPIP